MKRLYNTSPCTYTRKEEFVQQGLQEMSQYTHILTCTFTWNDLQEETLTHWPNRKCFVSKDWSGVDELKEQAALKGLAIDEVEAGGEVRRSYRLGRMLCIRWSLPWSHGCFELYYSHHFEFEHT